MEGLKSQKTKRSKSRLTVKLGLQLSKVGTSYQMAYYIMQGLGQKVNLSSIRNPEAEFTSPSFIKSLVRIEVWGKSLGEIRSER